MAVGKVTRRSTPKQVGIVREGAIHVLLCDDDANFLHWLQMRLKIAWRQGWPSFQIHAYCSPEAIPPEIQKRAEMVFLDIDFPGKRRGGIELARELRRSGNKGVLIFVTGYVDFATEGYEVRAFRYLLKDELDEKLRLTLSAAMEELNREREVFRFHNGGDVQSFLLEDMMYFKADGHACSLYIQGKESPYTLYTPLTELERQLEGQGFLRLHRCYLVNMRRIRRLQCDGATLDDGQTVPVGERGYAESKQKFLDWRAMYPYG